METNKREVNTEVETEVLDIANTPDEETGGDEQMVPPIDEDEVEKEEGQEEPDDTTSESSPDDDMPLKDVKGETPKERALRKEVTHLRAERRKAMQEALLQGVKPPAPTPSPNDERLARLKEVYSEEEFKNVEELVDYIAQQKGYVKKEQSYQETANQILESFIEDNPEYKAENDAEDVRWHAFERALHDYNLQDRPPPQMLSIFKKAHRDVMDEFGDTPEENTK